MQKIKIKKETSEGAELRSSGLEYSLFNTLMSPFQTLSKEPSKTHSDFWPTECCSIMGAVLSLLVHLLTCNAAVEI